MAARALSQPIAPDLDPHRILFGDYERPRDLKEAKALADEVVNGKRLRFASLKVLIESLNASQTYAERIIRRWKEHGAPPLSVFAPFAAHVLLIDCFLHVAVRADLISKGRLSNRIDIAYLYYMPFCRVFVSSDKLHARTAPLFMSEGQEFVHGPDSKADLAKLDAFYSQLPEGQSAGELFSWRHIPQPIGFF